VTALRNILAARNLTSLIAALPVLPLAGLAFAQPGAPETIERIKPSIVAVGSFQRLRSPQFSFAGTGFVVGDGLKIATNEHVVARIGSKDKGETLAIAIPKPGNKAAIRPARRLASDPHSDLALLGIEGPALPALPVADAAQVREGETYLLTGFPIGAILGLFPVTHRAMVAAISPIAIPAPRADQLGTSAVRRLNAGPFPVYQLDATAYPGNSGSPVYHPETGAVIGIVNSVFVKGSRESALTQPSGITYAIPARKLLELLNQGR
jgi:S1-C subfamily serine protease